ncbi:uncharacterized protein LOC101861444 [Aplysia californica]|uniref:Uncharacterized protein LOC101861444 n=1 Tax=Aplysia californica TaxID=6500 RepID=A0ABM0JSA5_APLCA|nr:uncharacterized protein LOC101861444 [Aplysia californica]
MASVSTTQSLVVLAVVTLAVGTWANLLNEDLPAGTCVCSTADTALNKRPGFVHPAVMYLLHDKCLLTHGNKTEIWGDAWYTIEVDEVLWGAGKTLAKGAIRQGVCGLPS